jgi:two-component system, chemotaxis family, response regulator Rcp1
MLDGLRAAHLVSPMATIPHILHIDDDENERQQFSRAFFNSGVVGALHSLSSASNALLYLNQKGPFASAPRPRLIIVDLQLPRSEGRQFHEMIQTNYKWKDIALIVLTGPQKNADIDRCHALGIHHFRKKPQSDLESIDLIQALAREYLGPLSEAPKTYR